MKNLVIIVIALLVGYLIRKIYEKWRDRNAKR
nr:MAG TPA: FeoB-associated Cys-rich membrane protein [Caudoviricetes sp.]